MDKKELHGLSLEDIMREFGSQPPPPEEPLGDTIRLDKVQKAVAQRAVGTDTAVFTPLGGEPEEPEPPEPPAPPKAEPYSENWEPEYDDPIGEYTAPIPFKPKDRLRQLRMKLMEGPEKRYYELTEVGVGKLKAGIFLSMLVLILAAAATWFYEAGGLSPSQEKVLIFGQLVLLGLGAAVGCYRLLDGLADILRLRFSLNTLLCIQFLLCAADGLVCLGSQRLPNGVPFCMAMVMSQIAAYQRRSSELSKMDTLRKAPDLQAVTRCEDFYAGKPGFVTVPGDLEDFSQFYGRTPGPTLALQIYGSIALVASLALGIWGMQAKNAAYGLQLATACLLMAMPASAFISTTAPIGSTEKRLHKLGVVLCGWHGVKAACKEAVYPLTHRDIFPEGTAKFNGVKFIGSADPGMVISYAASLVYQDGGTLSPLFLKLMEARGGYLRTVEDLHEYEGGLTALVDGDPVVLGSLEFMKRMQVRLPRDTQVAQAVYLAIGRELYGIFAVTYQKSKSSAAGLRTLCSYKELEPVMVGRDFMLTPAFLRNQFAANTDAIVRPDPQEREALSQTVPEEDAPVVALTTRPGLAPKAFAVTAARALRSAAKAGAVIHILGGLIGMLAVGVLVLAEGTYLLTPGNILTYWLLWMVPALLATQWTRFV